MPPHPVDILIDRIIQAGRVPRPDERQQITAHVAAANFADYSKRGDEWDLLGYPVVGKPLPSSPKVNVTPALIVKSIDAHFRKHESQWKPGTSAAGYLADLRAAARSPRAELHLGVFSSTPHVGIVLRLDAATAATMCVKFSPVLPNLFVVYSCAYGNIRSGYLVDNVALRTSFKMWKRYRKC